MDTSKDKICFFLPSLNGGGAERVILDLAAGFVDQGFSVDLVLSQANGQYLDQLPNAVRLINFNHTRVIQSIPSLVSYLRKERPKVMLSTLGHTNIAAILANWAAGEKTRLVLRVANSVSSLEGLPLRGKMILPLSRWLYPRAGKIVAVSDGVAEDLVKSLKLSQNQIQVIYNPVHLQQIRVKAKERADHPWLDNKTAPVILGVGRLTRQKDFSTLLRAFSILRKRQVARLIILGEGEERESLGELAKGLGMENDVDMPGFVDNPFSYMARADVFALSSRWEGLPNVLIQALALGTPVVSTRCPSGPSEILREGKYGKLVPIGDHVSLAQSISETLNSERADENPDDLNERCGLFEFDKCLKQYGQVLLG